MTVINSTSAALLGLLRDGPQTGYQLLKVASSVAPFWTMTRSQVYRELTAMADRGLVAREATGKRDSQPFSITPAGEEAFRAWLATEPSTDNLRIPLLLMLTFVDDVPRDHLREVLQRHYLMHRARLDEYETFAAALHSVPPLRRATLDYGIRHERAVLEWFEALPDDVRPDVTE